MLLFAVTFNNVLQTIPLVSNPLQACCSSILANLQASASLGSVDKANLQNYYTCAKTMEGVCSVSEPLCVCVCWCVWGWGRGEEVI